MEAARQLLADIPSLITGAAVLAACIGALWGIVAGALPGITTSVGTALLIPFTFALDPSIALMLLVGVNIGGEYAGSIPAILLRIPGEPSNAACMEDGYIVHQRGETGKALAFSLYPGTIATLFATVVFLFLSAPLVDFAIQMSPAGYFSLFVFALTAIAMFGDENPGKGFAAVFLGLALAAVGTDTGSAATRLNFGFREFADGLPLLPVIVGLFAISQVLIDISAKTLPAQASGGGKGLWEAMKLPKLREFRLVGRATAIGTAIGTVLGVLPGMGSTVSSFVAYSESRRWSKTPEQFGHGSYEGIAAPEAANNAVGPAALMPALALGIPGNGSSAMILAALVLQGFRPGPSLLEGAPELLSAVFMGLVLAAIATVVFGTLLLPLWVWLVSIKESIMMPIVMLLVAVGTFAQSGTIFDVWVALAMGLIGFFMIRYGFPIVATVIAFVLGDFIEQNLRRSLVLSDGSLSIFVTDRLSLVFLVFTVITATVMYLNQRKRLKQPIEASRE